MPPPLAPLGGTGPAAARPQAPRLLLLLLTRLAGISGYVCQVEMEENQEIQDTLGVECNVSEESQFCECSSTYWDDLHPEWLFLTLRLNHTMRQHAKEGYWYVLDKSGRCGAVFGPTGGTEPSLLSCPPGFYCPGKLHQPRSCSGGDHCQYATKEHGRRCKSGYFCPFPAAPMMKCMDGGYCPEGSTSPGACEPGFYCKDGLVFECPKDHYCPYASEAPKPCSAISLCPPGSATEDVRLFGSFIFATLAFIALQGARWYQRCVKNGFVVCAVATCFVGFMWLIDSIIAGFLTINFVAMVANVTLLQSRRCPSGMAKFLLCLTLMAALMFLWVMNPAWALLLGGLLLCSAVGYLMGRESRLLVFLGRFLLLCVFAALIFIYSKMDPEFMTMAMFLVGIAILLLFLEWVVRQIHGQCFPSTTLSAPFATRWAPANDLLHVANDTVNLLLEQSGGSFVGGAPLFNPSGPLSQAQRGEDPHRSLEGSMRGLEMVPSVSHAAPGVSFQMDGVNFRLPDGQVLLQDISLTIAAGKRVAVMGASGSGKSTLLSVLSGRASYGTVHGRVLVGGEQADDLQFLRHVTGFVPQDDVLHGELTVEENICFQAKLRMSSNMKVSDIESRVANVASDLNLSHIMSSRIGTPEKRGVSGGQRKRCSIAMELVPQPLLLFADEPTSGLDSTTAHEVVSCLNMAAEHIGTTVISVIHQPRYETLRLFDDLILLATGGTLVYAGPTDGVVANFQRHLQVEFPHNANPADVLLDVIQTTSAHPEEAWAALRNSTPQSSMMAGSVPRNVFRRPMPPFFRAVLIYCDRSCLQCMRAYSTVLANQILNVTACLILCTVVKNDRLDTFMMQACLASLFLMLLQGVAAMRIFGADLLITMREAQVGMSMVAYFVAKDLAAFLEITISAVVFATSYAALSGVQSPITEIFAGTWAFIYCVFGLSYIFSICLSPGAAQMSAVIAAFTSFCISGVYQPQLPELAKYLGGRGWIVPALSPVRWFYAYLLTSEAHYLTPLSRQYGNGELAWRGYDLDYLQHCSLRGIDDGGRGVLSLRDAWVNNRGWVCTGSEMIALGIIFRFLACVCLCLYVSTRTSAWSRFFGKADEGAWRIAGKIFTVVTGAFLLLFLFAEIWMLGIVQIEVKKLLSTWGIPSSVLPTRMLV